MTDTPTLSHEDAISTLKKALKLHQGNDLTKAKSLYETVLEDYPHFPPALGYFGLLEYQMGNTEVGLEKIDTALNLDPNNLTNIYNKANILRNLRRFKQAIKLFKSVLKQNPQHKNVRTDIAACYAEQKDIPKAIEHYREALTFNSDDKRALTGIARCNERVCDFRDYDALLDAQEAITKEQLAQQAELSMIPFATIYMPWDNDFKFEAMKHHVSWIKQRAKHISPLMPAQISDRKKIRIGYVSSDFSDSTVGYLIHQLFGHHNKNQFVPYAYSTGKHDNSDIVNTIAEHVNEFKDVSKLSEVELATLIQHDEIQILIDLTGYTNKSSATMFSLQPAPIQVNYLGYLGTLGADYMDYIITDNIVTPADEQVNYSEQFVTMPECYQINSHHQKVALTKARSDYGLTEDSFVFCCFNNNYKIDPRVFTTWMQLLNDIPNAVLWLLEESELGKTNLLAEAAKHGIDENRLIFAQKVSRQEHIARHQLADIYLDTFRVSARTSASDALWAGLPIITLPGNHFCNRVGASLLSAMNLPDLIAESPEDYYNKAKLYADNPKLLAKLKKTGEEECKIELTLQHQKVC